MRLIIDIGNTLVKYAVFDNCEIVYFEKSKDLKNSIITNIVNQYSINSSIVSSVRDEVQIHLDHDTLYLSNNTKLPFLINYKSPETFGKDRIANIAAVVFLYSLKNVLIIDAGSCITIDFVNKDGLYLGGRISPGLKMRYQALHHFTAKLPELTIQKEFLVLGNDTDSSIISGVQVGVLSEIQTVITDFKKENDDLFVIITGGDTFFFENALKSTIFADQDLVLKGLNEILKYNE